MSNHQEHQAPQGGNMKQLLKQYFDAKLAKYRQEMTERGAMIAAKYALDDMALTVRRNLEIYGQSDAGLLLSQEIEDVHTAIKATK